MRLRRFLMTACLAALPLVAAAPAAQAQGTIRIGMTAADIPLTNGQPDQGFEGNRFTGIPLFDSLTMWDLSSADRPSTVIPGLATEWRVDPNDRTRWIFTLRRGVRFHDGSEFNADAVVWNVRKVLDREAPHFDPRQVGVTATRMPTLRRAEKIDDYTVALITSEPDSLLPINLTNLFMASPAQWDRHRAASPNAEAAWGAFAREPSGTGPFRVTRFVPRERLEMARFDGYWGEKARAERIVLLPIPEANARTAALLSNQVDWIEAPSPDAMPQLRQRGMVITSNAQPHVWPWQPCFVGDSPLRDVRVRRALNLAIDREAMRTLLGGMMAIPVGTVPRGHPWFGNPSFNIRTDKAEARRLLAEAGYGPNRPLTLRVQISASGSGQMQPLSMNEFLQQDLKEVGVNVEFDVIEWNALFTNWRNGCQHASARGAHATNVSFAAMDPFFAMVRFWDSKMAPPVSNNWGHFNDPRFDAMIAEARNAFEPAERDAALARLHAAGVDEALFIWIAHDVAPRAMSPRIRGYVQPQSWFVDLRLPYIQ
ncbi:ABC transporter substrate-binding protein [Neoroseomonas oryzicola]|uniref:ABC transporter substrate-binding protein n=1 Tax=Neoroseomonas oryzicola TaxID=535904 RepID=A0A9X9WFN3_9PROT|nr:ABC transporter substrate-binding protein [Neoroseomonas oryzicola]MBR0659143.1 ABC transporter substrate-binding protein [Neoroseomonas oryzicola]NKE17715.1 ABC transporter substrate-binding protein [Neoroseomonas oryzicola]